MRSCDIDDARQCSVAGNGCVISISIRPAPAANATENAAPRRRRGWISMAGPISQLRCAECRLWGQDGRIDGDVAIKRQIPERSPTACGYRVWPADHQRRAGERPFRGSNLAEGRLHGNKTDAFAHFFGVSTPVKDSPFDIHYDLHWRAALLPHVASLNGIIKSHLGKGQFHDPAPRHAGQLPRLLQVDALPRKSAFRFQRYLQRKAFTSIRLTVRAWIKDGVLHTDDTLVDGLESGYCYERVGRFGASASWICRRWRRRNISATVGVAAALWLLNPIVPWRGGTSPPAKAPGSAVE